MKYKENYGIEQSYELDTGYCKTGAIPEIGDNILTANADMAEETRMEAKERKMYKEMGIIQDEDVGGFLERRNTDDRM
jgi:hypothetical protein